MLTSGDLIKDRYKIIKHLGSGGFGDTYLAEDTQVPSRRKCVVKQLKPIEDDSNIFKLVTDRFQREAAILENLGHNHTQVPDLYANFEDDGKFYLVQEYVEGQTLAEKVAQEGPMSDGVVRDLLAKLLPALEYVHSKGIVHRDLKPENAIVRESDGLPVLIDFGAVRETMGTILDSKGSTSRSIIIGTEGFMPPEQAAGRPLFSSDLYSLALTAIFCLTGDRPGAFQNDPHTGVLLWRLSAPQVSSELADVLDRAIQINIRDRFSNAKDMLAALTGPSTVVQSGSLSPNPTVVEPIPSEFPQRDQVSQPRYPTPYPHSAQLHPTHQSSGIPEWAQAFIIGGLIGGSILLLVLIFVVVRQKNQPNNGQPSANSMVRPKMLSRVTLSSPQARPYKLTLAHL